MNKRVSAAVAAAIVAIGASVASMATPAQAGDTKVLIFPTPKAWGLGSSGWVQTRAYLVGIPVTPPCRNALRCNSVFYAHTTNGAQDGALLEQAFRGNTASARFNFNGSVAGFAGPGLTVRTIESSKMWRVTTVTGFSIDNQANERCVVAEWKGSGNHHRVAAIAYYASDQLLSKHPLRMTKLVKGAKSMAAPSGGAVTLLTDV